MNIANKKEKQNPLLSRKEYTLQVVFEGATPSKKEAKKEVSKAVKADENLCVVREVKTSFGSNKAVVTMFVYDKADDMKRIEGYVVRKKSKTEEEKKEEVKEEVKEEKE